MNVRELEQFENGSVVDLQALIENGIVRKSLDGLKILGEGELTKSLTVKAEKFSKGAVEKIQACGGKVEVI